MKISKQNKEGSLSVTLPIDICRAYGWKQGDELGYKIEKAGQLILFKK